MNKLNIVKIMLCLLITTNCYSETEKNLKENKNSETISYPALNHQAPVLSKSTSEEDKNLKDILSKEIVNESSSKEDVSEFRKQAITEIAFSLGASYGLANRMETIKKDVNLYAKELDLLYDFSKLKVENGVIPPVLTEGVANYSKNDDDQIRIADKIYRIESPAKFVSVYPTWRSYLRFSYPVYEKPNKAYLPKNDTEKQIWDNAIKSGWEKGISQANSIFENSYNKLEKDYLGMIKYKILLSQGLITKTMISKQNLGVTGGGTEMSINDQIFRITDHSALNPNQKLWKTEYPISNDNNGELK